MTTGIEWTDATWNPMVGCTPVSAGCLNCYAATMARRLEGMGKAGYEPRRYDHAGRTVRIAEVRGGRAVFTGEVRCLPERLVEPLRWRKPRRVFVNSMSDLFHESVSDQFLRLVFAAMSYAGQHTFQVLTKRPERMAAWFADPENSLDACQAEWVVEGIDDKTPTGKHRIGRRGSEGSINGTRRGVGDGNYWPLPNVWLGTSVENQEAADERIPHLLRCPAPVRFLSCEPLLGPVDLTRIATPLGARVTRDPTVANKPVEPTALERLGSTATIDCLAGSRTTGEGLVYDGLPHVQWVIAGGESGPRSRPCVTGWLRSLRDQCRAAGVPFFLKQLGTNPKPLMLGATAEEIAETTWRLKDPKGGDPAEWPEDLRVREMPSMKGGA